MFLLKKSEFLGGTETCAEYKDVFGKGYHLQYVPQNTGIKENIIIEKNRKNILLILLSKLIT